MQNIKELSLTELENSILKFGEKSFRERQIYEWLWKKNIKSFSEISNISKDLRTVLENNFSINYIKIGNIQRSIDKSIKYTFELLEKNLVEGVLIPSSERVTACISTQIGCSLSCKFCATGALGFLRNLTKSEIYEQVFVLNEESIKEFGRSLTNIVIMGMGEPLINYDNTLAAIDLITSKHGLEMSPSRITLSTSGVTKMIKKLADDNVKFNLAVSLHTANNKKRDFLMSINKTNDLTKLTDAVKYFYGKTKTRVTFEYLLLENFNNSLSDAKELAEFCKSFPCKINLIEYNEVENSEFSKSSEKNTKQFIEYLESKNLIINLRKSKGTDIDAACGQLANKLKKMK
jgi:23S rRNA (adenine2503-C2)-methyltransferase